MWKTGCAAAPGSQFWATQRDCFEKLTRARSLNPAIQRVLGQVGRRTGRDFAKAPGASWGAIASNLKAMSHRILLALIILASMSAAAEPDWPAVKSEALETLVALVRLDTAQPEGNEIRAARYLKEKLDREGMPAEIVESAPGRASIVARVKGNGNKRPLLLLGHLDVVAVERDEWSFDPFGGEVKDGILYARGASDDKGVVAGSFHVFLELWRQKTPLDRDVIFLGVADEEAGGVLGITYMLDKHRDKIEAEFAINEAGKGVFDRDLRYSRFEIQTAEKTPRRIDLKAVGTSGHGSIPLKDNPVGALARAVGRLSEHEMPPRLNETTREYFSRLAEISAPDKAEVFRAVITDNPTAADYEKLRELSPVYHSMVRTSIVPTILQGGYLRNVIPSEAHATVDIRALPDEDPERLFSLLKGIMDEPAVDLVPHPQTRPSHSPSALTNDAFLAFETVLNRMYPSVPILPTMSTGATDSAQLRSAGIASYGFGPARPEWDLASGIHGRNEYLYVKPYQDYVEILWNVVVELAGTH